MVLPVSMSAWQLGVNRRWVKACDMRLTALEAGSGDSRPNGCLAPKNKIESGQEHYQTGKDTWT